MNKDIANALLRKFENYRIVFWYDSKKELKKDFENLSIPDVEKIEIKNDEFKIKHIILREKPEQKFLIYKEDSQPDDLHNWLLDVQLAHTEFSTDQSALWLNELGLGIEFSEIVDNHEAFFRSSKRIDTLKGLISTDDGLSKIKLKMLAVCAETDPRIDMILESLLAELANEKESKIDLIKRCSLDKFLWESLRRFYNYQSDSCSIKDFIYQLFKDIYCSSVDPSYKTLFYNDASVFLKRWKDSRYHEKSFEIISEKCSHALKIENDLFQKDYKDLLELDLFRIIEQKIISDLVAGIANRTISTEDCAQSIRQRRQSHWYNEFNNIYKSLDYSSQFVFLADQYNLELNTLNEGVLSYTDRWYKLDLLYRKFIYYCNEASQPSLLGKLCEQVENIYSNKYLLAVNDNWQKHIDSLEKWNIPGVTLQKDFEKIFVQQTINTSKLFVIISDGLRYEIACELMDSIREMSQKKNNMYNAEIDYMLSMLPSYTQLGMAALLPNKELEINTETGNVSADGMSTQGLENRKKVLLTRHQKSTAVRAKEVLQYSRNEIRTICRDNNLVYIYHNLIDNTGDKKESEEKVFNAAQQTIDEITRIITRIAGENYVANFIVTADHGFIYQNSVIDESDFAGLSPKGKTISYQDRRFVFGDGLEENISMKKFTSEQLGITGNCEVLIPKSINRMRLKGSGSRYVHGGASLQETILPVLKVSKKRGTDVRTVDVDIIRGGNSIISSGQLAVVFYQTEPVDEKTKPRKLRAGIYTIDGKLISDMHELNFDFASNNPRKRELSIRFILIRTAEDYNGQNVVLKLEDPDTGTTIPEEYKTMKYTLKRSFTSDFDF